MGNMSYCRFRNTLADLRDCYESMDEETNRDEQIARLRLIKFCIEIASDYGDDISAAVDVDMDPDGYKKAVARLSAAPTP